MTPRDLQRAAAAAWAKAGDIFNAAPTQRAHDYAASFYPLAHSPEMCAAIVAELAATDAAVLFRAMAAARVATLDDYERAALAGDIARRSALTARLDAMAALLGDPDALALIVKELSQ